MKRDPNSKRSKIARDARLLRRMSKSGCFVYGLYDWEGRCVYVGQTRTPLQTRLENHYRVAGAKGSPIQRWLQTNGADIRMIEAKAVWDVDEILWIERLLLRGEPLLNVTRGGCDNRTIDRQAMAPTGQDETLAQPLGRSHDS